LSQFGALPTRPATSSIYFSVVNIGVGQSLTADKSKESASRRRSLPMLINNDSSNSSNSLIVNPAFSVMFIVEMGKWRVSDLDERGEVKTRSYFTFSMFVFSAFLATGCENRVRYFRRSRTSLMTTSKGMPTDGSSSISRFRLIASSTQSFSISDVEKPALSSSSSRLFNRTDANLPRSFISRLSSSFSSVSMLIIFNHLQISQATFRMIFHREKR
jgi:hypothetical protein